MKRGICVAGMPSYGLSGREYVGCTRERKTAPIRRKMPESVPFFLNNKNLPDYMGSFWMQLSERMNRLHKPLPVGFLPREFPFCRVDTLKISLPILINRKALCFRKGDVICEENKTPALKKQIMEKRKNIEKNW